MKKRVGVLGVAVVMGCLGAVSLFASGSLDGKTFTGTIAPKGQTEGKADSFVFQNGQFESTLCGTFGYGKGVYQSQPKPEGMEFTAETASNTGGRMQWKGLVKGAVIEGTALSMENGQTTEQRFKGTLQTKKN